MMDGFMQLVKDMRAAQKEVYAIEHAGVIKIAKDEEFMKKWNNYQETLKRADALERRVDEEIAAAERQDQTNDPDCIRMANGQTLRQGNLFEDQ